MDAAGRLWGDNGAGGRYAVRTTHSEPSSSSTEVGTGCRADFLGATIVFFALCWSCRTTALVLTQSVRFANFVEGLNIRTPIRSTPPSPLLTGRRHTTQRHDAILNDRSSELSTGRTHLNAAWHLSLH